MSAPVVLYSAAGCHLCEEARAEIDAVRRRRPFELREIDVALDPVLHARYGERIPVLEIDGEEAFELFVDEAALERRLDRVDA